MFIAILFLNNSTGKPVCHGVTKNIKKCSQMILTSMNCLYVLHKHIIPKAPLLFIFVNSEQMPTTGKQEIIAILFSLGELTPYDFIKILIIMTCNNCSHQEKDLPIVISGVTLQEEWIFHQIIWEIIICAKCCDVIAFHLGRCFRYIIFYLFLITN